MQEEEEEEEEFHNLNYKNTEEKIQEILTDMYICICMCVCARVCVCIHLRSLTGRGSIDSERQRLKTGGHDHRSDGGRP